MGWGGHSRGLQLTTVPDRVVHGHGTKPQSPRKQIRCDSSPGEKGVGDGTVINPKILIRQGTGVTLEEVPCPTQSKWKGRSRSYRVASHQRGTSNVTPFDECPPAVTTRTPPRNRVLGGDPESDDYRSRVVSITDDEDVLSEVRVGRGGKGHPPSRRPGATVLFEGEAFTVS